MITIGLLADHLDTLPTLTKWFRAQWPTYYASWSDEEMEQDFLEGATRENLPIRLVALNAGELAGTIVLREPGGTLPPGFRPELGGLYVVDSQRGHGIGTELVRAGMQQARDQGYEALFATTVSAAGIVERLGWTFVQSVMHRGEALAFYRCDLRETPNRMTD